MEFQEIVDAPKGKDLEEDVVLEMPDKITRSDLVYNWDHMNEVNGELRAIMLNNREQINRHIMQTGEAIKQVVGYAEEQR